MYILRPPNVKKRTFLNSQGRFLLSSFFKAYSLVRTYKSL